MSDKISQVCDYILDRIENGEYEIGKAIPVARKLTQEVNASFAIVQHAVNLLSKAGVLRSISRQGSVVREEWQDSLMPNHFVIFSPEAELCWIPGFQKLLAKKLPDFRLSPACRAAREGSRGCAVRALPPRALHRAPCLCAS